MDHIKWVVGWNFLVTASSRMSSSEIGALSHSTKFALGDSVPIQGVLRNDSN